MRSLLPLLALLAASCGGDSRDSEPEGDPSPDELANRIENASTLREPEETAPPRMAALDEGEIPAEFLAGPACRLSEGERLLLVAAAPGALARIDGRPVRLRVAGPVGPSGGYFEAPGVTVSIGRKVAGVRPDAAVTAGVTIGGNPNLPLEERSGRWDCIAASP